MDRRLAAILAADVVGYSRLMGEAEEETHERLHSYLDKIKQISAQHNGRVFGTFGDSVIVEFASPVESVRCAIEIQAFLHGINATVPPGRQMLVRIGINLGDVLVEDENLYGDGVNIAARLESLALPGGITISDEVFRQVNKKIDCKFQDMGEKHIKNIAEPVHIYNVIPQDSVNGGAVTCTAARKIRQLTLPIVSGISCCWIVAVYINNKSNIVDAKAGYDKPSVAVLPFKNLSNNSDQKYISDGITSDITTDLSKFEELYVPRATRRIIMMENLIV